jgi:hypothetical protein
MAKEQVAGTSRRKSMRTGASPKAPAPIGKRSPIAPARRLPRSPAKAGETFCSAPRCGACHSPSIGAPVPMQPEAVPRQCAPVPAIPRERPPKPARLFSALRAAGYAAAPALEPSAPMAIGAVSRQRPPAPTIPRDLPRKPARRFAPLRGACHSPSIGAPVPMQPEAVPRQCAPVPAIPRECPPEPTRPAPALRAARYAVASSLELPSTCGGRTPAISRDLPRTPASSRVPRRGWESAWPPPPGTLALGGCFRNYPIRE